MKIAIVGAGAIGGLLGAKLSLNGVDVSLIARGQHLYAMQKEGVRIQTAKEELVAWPEITDSPANIGVVDYVLLTVKAHSLTQVGPRLGPLLDSNTVVVSAQNGIPWWYFELHGGPLDGTRLTSLDPGGVIAESISFDRIIGCVVYPTAMIVRPGVIYHLEGDRFTLGELDGTKSDRCQLLAKALINSGLKSPVSTRIRRDLWVKLLGNVAFNPISALTRAGLASIASNYETSRLAKLIMEEADSVASALGVEIPITVDQRLAGAAKVGEHKTSMLQDVEQGRPIELESIVGAVLELGDKLGIEMSNTRAVYACTKLLARNLS